MQDVQAGGVGPRCAQRLESTSAIHKALQAAYLCRRGILTDRHPQWVLSQKLPDMPGAPDASLATSFLLSPDSSMCAVCYGSDWVWDGEQAGGYPTEHAQAVYTWTGEFKHYVCSGRLSDMHWSPCSRYLYLQGAADDDNSTEAGIEVFDTLTGQMVHPPWSHKSRALLSRPDASCTWSPDIALLLCTCAEGSREDGWEHTRHVMHVVRVEDGALLASVKICGQPCNKHPNACEVSASHAWAMWHSGSRGLVIAGCSWLVQGPQPLQALGLSVGHLPLPAHMGHSSSFSPSGRLLSALHPLKESGDYNSHPKSQIVILLCTELDRAYNFEALHTFGDLSAPVAWGGWCPGQHASDALLMIIEHTLRLVSPTGELLGQPSKPGR